MIAPSVDLQGAIVSAIAADADLMRLVGGVYDRVPEDPYGIAHSYISFGPSTVDPADLECLRAERHVIQLDVWSRDFGRVLCANVCHRVTRILDGVTLPLSEHGFVRGGLTLMRILPDPADGVIHGVLQFGFDLEDMS